MMELRMTLLFVIQVHKDVIQSIYIICAGPKGLGDFYERALGDISFLQ